MASAEKVVSLFGQPDAGHVQHRSTLTDAGVAQRVALRDGDDSVHNEITDGPKRQCRIPRISSTAYARQSWAVHNYTGIVFIREHYVSIRYGCIEN